MVNVVEIAVRDSRLVRIDERLDGDRVKVRDLATGGSSEVSLSSLQGRSAVAAGASIDAHLEVTRASADVAWRQATTREQALGALFKGAGAAATSSLVPLTRGVAHGTRRLDANREALVSKIIEQEYLSRSRPSIEEIVRKVERRCVALKYKSVSRNANSRADPPTRSPDSVRCESRAEQACLYPWLVSGRARLGERSNRSRTRRRDRR